MGLEYRIEITDQFLGVQITETQFKGNFCSYYQKNVGNELQVQLDQVLKSCHLFYFFKVYFILF